MGKPKIGFIGVGVMGYPMVRNLLKAGFPVTVYDRVKAKMARIAGAGAATARSNAELAAGAEVIILMVDTTESARKALFGTRGVWETIRPGSTVIIMSSIDPSFCQEVAREGKKRGVACLDVPVSGRGKPVEDGTVTLFCGGDAEVIARHSPILRAMGGKLFHMGAVGMGEVAKLCNNYITTVTSALLIDVLKVACRAGVDLETLYEALTASSANSRTLQQSWRSLVKETAAPGTVFVKHSPRNLYKDLKLMMELAEKLGHRVPLAGLASQLDLTRFRPAAMQEKERG